MKKATFSVFTILALLWGCNVAFAKGEGKGKGKEGAKPGTEGIERKDKAKHADVNDLGKQEPAVRQQARERGRFRDREEGQKEQQGRVHPAKTEVRQETEGKGKGHQQQLSAIDRQINQEEAKHRSRVARLNRIRQLAQEDGKTETVQRVDKLLEKEQKRYESKSQTMIEKKQKVLQLGEKGAGKEAQQAVEKVKKDKEKSEKSEVKDLAKDANQ